MEAVNLKLEELINTHYEKLNQNDLLIWNYILKHRKVCEKLSIDQLAERCSVSRTSIMRFVQKLSLKGYSELKVYLRLENAQPDMPGRSIDQVCRVYEELIHTMREMDCTEIFELIDQAKRLYVYGAGMIQTTVQREVKRIFLTANKIFLDINGPNESRKLAGAIREEDLVVIISVSGESESVLEFAQTLKIRNVPFISITKRNENALARMSRHHLYITTRTLNLFYGGIDYETVTSFFLLIELLFLKYVEYKERGEENCEAGRTGQKELREIK